jgi:hypothetical protein
LAYLALARAPDVPFQAPYLHETFGDARSPIRVELVQVEAALTELARNGLLRDTKTGYRILSPLLVRIARERFWNDPVERDRLVGEVRRQSRHRAEIGHFFRSAGFEAVPFESGFTVTSSRTEYGLLGAGRGIYVHPYTASAVDAETVDEMRSGAYRAYGGQLSGRVAFLIVSTLADLATARRLAAVRRAEGLWPVLLAHPQLRRAAEPASARETLDSSLQRALGKKDLFKLDGPVVNVLDFYGREQELGKLAGLCREGRAIGLMGMARVGKTSLVRQAMDRLPDAIVAWREGKEAASDRLYGAVRRAWLTEAGKRFPSWQRPDLEAAEETLGEAELQADVERILAGLGVPSPAAHLIVVLDGVPGTDLYAPGIRKLARVLAAVEGASLVAVLDAWCELPPEFVKFLLRPLEPRESAELVSSLAEQMGIEFDPAAIDELVQASGGHPYLLRQLASLSLVQEPQGYRHVAVTHACEAISQYAAQRDGELSRLWHSLSEDERRTIHLSLVARPPGGSMLAWLQDLGWLHRADAQWQLVSRALARWLDGPLAPDPP